MKLAFLNHADANSTAACLQCENMLFYNIRSIFLTRKGEGAGSCGLCMFRVPKTTQELLEKQQVKSFLLMDNPASKGLAYLSCI